MLFGFLYNISEAPALWTTLPLWILDKTSAVTRVTGLHPIFFRVENLFIHFSPRSEEIQIALKSE
jgi:hypothetical protein